MEYKQTLNLSLSIESNYDFFFFYKDLLQPHSLFLFIQCELIIITKKSKSKHNREREPVCRETSLFALVIQDVCVKSGHVVNVLRN